MWVWRLEARLKALSQWMHTYGFTWKSLQQSGGWEEIKGVPGWHVAYNFFRTLGRIRMISYLCKLSFRNVSARLVEWKGEDLRY